MQSVKLPPYGKELHQLIKSDKKPLNDVYLFIGKDAWKKGAAFHISYPERILILPPWLSANDYFWPVVGCDILLTDTGYAKDEYLDEIALALFRHGANIIRFISPDFSISVFKKE